MRVFRVIALIGSIAFFVGFVAFDHAVPSEKFKLRTVKYAVKVESAEGGDQKGHIVLTYEAKGITSNREGKWFEEGWVHRMVLLIDMNLKTGQGSLEGYEAVADRDGNKYC